MKYAKANEASRRMETEDFGDHFDSPREVLLAKDQTRFHDPAHTSGITALERLRQEGEEFEVRLGTW